MMDSPLTQPADLIHNIIILQQSMTDKMRLLMTGGYMIYSPDQVYSEQYNYMYSMVLLLLANTQSYVY